jgi:DNA-binding NtrC family response regulator
MVQNAQIGILVADRNPRVRAFLQREMTGAGYRVYTADSARDVLRRVLESDTVDLLIIDPDFPDADPAVLLGQLRDGRPRMPVVIHAFPEPEVAGLRPAAAGFVEKGASSVERLKHLVQTFFPGG